MKPLARGYVHQAAFFISLICCSILIIKSYSTVALIPNIIYSLTLTGMYGISALFHSPTWDRKCYLFMKRIDHAAIFCLIAGTATPICLLGLKNEKGLHLLALMWVTAAIGMLAAIFWIHAPKWLRAILYVAMGWFAIPYLSEIKSILGLVDTQLLLTGGIIYTIGALVYALKRPNPYPNVFGYHEIFHVLIVIASIFHFLVIYSLIKR